MPIPLPSSISAWSFGKENVREMQIWKRKTKNLTIELIFNTHDTWTYGFACSSQCCCHLSHHAWNSCGTDYNQVLWKIHGGLLNTKKIKGSKLTVTFYIYVTIFSCHSSSDTPLMSLLYICSNVSGHKVQNIYFSTIIDQLNIDLLMHTDFYIACLSSISLSLWQKEQIRYFERVSLTLRSMQTTLNHWIECPSRLCLEAIFLALPTFQTR